jgi:hypothetical protein
VAGEGEGGYAGNQAPRICDGGYAPNMKH